MNFRTTALIGTLAASLGYAPMRVSEAAAHSAATAATLRCADPRLPPAILAGKKIGVPTAAAALPVVAAAVRENGSAEPLGTPRVSVVPPTPSPTLLLAVAADPRSRELGLMCVTALRRNAGMIFVFPRDDWWEFWMKNTVTPLDMLWVAPDGLVREVAAGVPAATLDAPDEKVARRRGRGRYVIELSSGEAARLHISTGAYLELPRLVAADENATTPP